MLVLKPRGARADKLDPVVRAALLKEEAKRLLAKPKSAEPKLDTRSLAHKQKLFEEKWKALDMQCPAPKLTAYSADRQAAIWLGDLSKFPCREGSTPLDNMLCVYGEMVGQPGLFEGKWSRFKLLTETGFNWHEALNTLYLEVT
jgi:hypothetical protein